jgi:transcriptional regulator with PAS, ATPase and Fis domain
VCARAATRAVEQANGTGAVRFACHPDRLELAAPIRVQGVLLGCALAGARPGADEQFLGELLELAAEEMVSFSTEVARRPTGGVRYAYEGIVGKSRPMADLYRLLDKVIGSDSTVLIQGENGTGKELIAKAIHYNSPRAHERFVVQNCSAFNDNLLDSELFGHKKGAFTGAVADKQGLFEVADRGTFFLDEIGDMSPALQVKLLRVLQEGTFTPVGDTDSRRVDVRIIAATNKDLRQMVHRGEFREDLYYRVNVISLTVPPLRDRREDIPLLIDHFLRKNARGQRARQKKLLKGCFDRILEYAWPGNIRELENEIERLVVLAGDEKAIGESLLSSRIRQHSEASTDGHEPSSLPAAVDALERNLIYETLKRNQWNKTRAALELRISRRNLIRKVSKYKLEPRRRS